MSKNWQIPESSCLVGKMYHFVSLTESHESHIVERRAVQNLYKKQLLYLI